MLSFSSEQIKEISEQLDCGFRAFYHKQTGELMFVPNTNRYFDMDTSAWEEELDKLEENFLDYQEIYAMEASDSFKVMADFTEQRTDERLQEKLINALNKKGPFRQFKFIIDNSGEHRQHWFDFKNKRYIEWVEDQLKTQNQLDDRENASH
jgi:Uncharacterised protein family (UPF0158)